MNIDNNTKIFLGDREIVEVKRGGVTIWEKSSEPEIDYFYIENAFEGTNTLTLTSAINGSPSTDTYSSTVEYSKDKTNWTTVNFDTTTPYDITMNQGEKVYFRNDNGKFNYYSKSNHYYTIIDCSQTNNAGGNINSLLDYNNIDSVTLPIGAFHKLFQGNNKLVNATNLVLTHNVISSYALSKIFSGCSSLTTPPDLSNVTSIGLSGLNSAFQGTSLTNGPDLSNVSSIGNYGLEKAFDGCTSLTNGPDLSNVSSIGKYGLYYAFDECTSLTNGPDLSNVTSIGDSGLMYAFSGCSSLTTPPNLSNVTSIDRNGLRYAFAACSSLTTGPDLSNVSSIGSYSLYRAFTWCSKISTVTAPNVSDLTQNYALNEWLENAGTEVTDTKTVNVPTGATITTNSISGIPTGWVRVNY